MCTESRQRGIDFLLGRCNGGLWFDYAVAGTQSDEWVTAYVAHALAETGIADATGAACAAWARLKQLAANHGPGLGYHRWTPQDADSTGWGVRLAIALGASHDPINGMCLDFLQRHVRPDGGVATYNVEDLVRSHGANSETEVAGWTSSHLCVTAAVAYIPEIGGESGGCQYLVSGQDADGRWRAYWSPDDEYATAHAIESLARNGRWTGAVQRAASWLAGRAASSSASVLALRIIGLRRAGWPGWHALLHCLVSLQLPDGSWPASAQLRTPPPDLIDPRRRWRWDRHSTGAGSIMVDQNRTFTTATVLRALTACLSE